MRELFNNSRILEKMYFVEKMYFEQLEDNYNRRRKVISYARNFSGYSSNNFSAMGEGVRKE